MTQQDTLDEATGPVDPAGDACHVLVVVENIPAADDQRVRKQVPALLAAGHQVTVVTRRDPAHDAWRNLPGLTMLEHPAPPEPRHALGYLGEYGLAFAWAAVLALSAHRRRPVDVVQFCQPPDVYFPLAWLMRGLGAGVAVDQRDLMPELFADRYGSSRLMTRVLNLLERRTQRAADVTVTVNQYLRTRLEDAGARADSLAVVANGPRLDRVETARPDPALRAGATTLCCWEGKMGRQDRVDLLVEAIAVLVHERGRRDCRFVLLGNGECLEELQTQVAELDLDDRVLLPGWLSEEDLFTYLATADIGLDTSLQAEVSPVKVMEYMAFGLPVVAFDLPETTALMGGAGVTVPPGDTRQFAAELDALLDDPARAARLGRAGRRRVVGGLSWERQCAGYLEAIDRAASAARRRRRRTRGAGRGVRTRRELSMTDCDVVVIGAGPYGLAATAHLRRAGVSTHVLGDPMSFWRTMPEGMLLRSNRTATSIAEYDGPLSLESYAAATGWTLELPVPLERFVDYGMWVQRAAAPDVDRRHVRRLARENGSFVLELDDGDRLRAGRVVVACGIADFVHRPAAGHDLSPELVSHTSEHRDLSRFAGRRVLVVGGGQSALESAALMHEHGAEVEVAVRADHINWLHGGVWHRRLGRATPLVYAPTDVGPMGLSRLVALPDLFGRLPRGVADPLAYRAIRPAGAKWLRPRLEGVDITFDAELRTITPADDGGVRVGLSTGEERRVDHVMMGTGYRVDITRYGFLDPALAAEIRSIDGYPQLRRGMETSVPGLHIVGAPAARSFGPTMRFVSGSWYTARELTRVVAGSAWSPRPRVARAA